MLTTKIRPGELKMELENHRQQKGSNLDQTHKFVKKKPGQV